MKPEVLFLHAGNFGADLLPVQIKVSFEYAIVTGTGFHDVFILNASFDIIAFFLAFFAVMAGNNGRK
jgi:hypothetical protein